jgi:hypothetical protein
MASTKTRIFALVRTELPWVNAQNGNQEQSSTSMAVHCTLMTRYSSLKRERDDLEKGSSCLYAHWHRSNAIKDCGSFLFTARRLYSDAGPSRLGVLDYLGNAAGFIDFTTEFKYLGSIVLHSLTSDADVDKHIR